MTCFFSMLVMITHDTLSSDSSKTLPVTITDTLAIATLSLDVDYKLKRNK